MFHLPAPWTLSPPRWSGFALVPVRKLDTIAETNISRPVLRGFWDCRLHVWTRVVLAKNRVIAADSAPLSVAAVGYLDEGFIMNKAVVILVNGEVLSDKLISTIDDQRERAHQLAENLLPILKSDLQVTILHGNKPQVGYVLYRSELASHVLHAIPLDVCGADTQGATGYMLVQSLHNVLVTEQHRRSVMSVVTQTIVDAEDPLFHQATKAIGPFFDRDKAEQHRLNRNWEMMLEPGRGYRRVVSAPTPVEIVEIEGIKQLVQSGTIVVAAGGGGIPVIRTANGGLKGVEAVVDTDRVSCMIAERLQAPVMIMIIERNDKFALLGLNTEQKHHLTLKQLDSILEREPITSQMVKGKLEAAARFLHTGGEQMIITTLRKLPETLEGKAGLHIGLRRPFKELLGEGVY
jgi:carbamate kinase